ncbi:MAG: 16S rRNA (uracil(1498)-N(3))-methyltransferase [Cellulomonas sp.]
MSAPVFLVEPGALAGTRPGGTYLLDGAEGRHAGVVQRRSEGERVDVVDGAGVRLACLVGAVDGEGVTLQVVARTDEPAPQVALVLVQALAKGDRDELAIEAATEVGVDVVVPWQAERSVVVWRGDRAAKSRSRWLGTVRAAAKQSRRAWIPEVELAVDGRGLVERVRRTVGDGGVALVLHEEASEPLAQVDLSVLDGSVAVPGQRREVLVVVGPEGGISARELEALVGIGARPVRLGPHVLRTSTAGPIALALLAQRLGRWG